MNQNTEQEYGLYDLEGGFKSNSEIAMESLDKAGIEIDEEFLPTDVSFEEFHNEATRRARFRKKVEGESRSVEITIPTDRPVAVCLFSDIHFGSGGVDYELLKETADIIKDHPLAYAILGGDITDSLFFDYGEEIMNMQEQWVYMSKLLNHLGGESILAGVLGNHGAWSRKAGVHTHFNFNKETKRPLLRGKSYVTLTIGDQPYKIMIAHQFKGYSMYNPNHPQSRANREVPGADIYMSAHCFDDKTEILTPTGWVNGLGVQESDMVGTMNKESGEIEWNVVNEYVEYSDYKELYEFKTKHLSLCTTDKHGMIYYNRDSDVLRECTMKELSEKKRVVIPIANQTKLNNKKDALLQRWLIWVVTDGSILRNKGVRIKSNSIRFHLNKKRKIDRLVKLLDDSGYKYTRRTGADGNEDIKIYEQTGIINKYFPVRKVLGDWVLDFDPAIVKEEYGHTDGTFCGEHKRSVQIGSAKREEIDLLQRFFILGGYSAVANFKRKVPTLYVHPRTRVNAEPNKSIKKIPYSGKVWCVNVDNGTLVVRREGKVAITQNTHKPGEQAQYQTDFGGKTRKIVFMNGKTFKNLDAYGKDKGFTPVTDDALGANWIILSPDKKMMRVVSSNEEMIETMQSYL